MINVINKTKLEISNQHNLLHCNQKNDLFQNDFKNKNLFDQNKYIRKQSEPLLLKHNYYKYERKYTNLPVNHLPKNFYQGNLNFIIFNKQKNYIKFNKKI